MKLFFDIRNVCRASLMAAATATLCSCSLMHDDLPDCATRPQTRTNVSFVYDYNTAGEDKFPESVGSVTLYVFDENGSLVREIEHSASSTGGSLNQPGFSVDLDLPAGTYQLYAAAQESADGYAASLETPGAKFRRPATAEGFMASDMVFSLDHNAGTVEHQQMPLEHLWLTHIPQILTVTEAPMPAEGDPQPADVIIQATVPLQRVTNNIHLTLTRDLTGTPATRAAETLSPADYDIWISTATGRDRLDLVGNPTQDATTLTFTPHATQSATANGQGAVEADLSVSRLFTDSDAARHDKLCIRAKLSGEVFEFDLPSLLTQCSAAYPGNNWSEQEFLDREYDYNIAVHFDERDMRWKFVELSVGILKWHKRIQNADL